MNILLDRQAHPVIGHRGAAGLAPENTLPGFRRALEAGAEALELDVRLTADGQVIVLHDPTLDRTTDRRGPVSELSWEAVSQADAGCRFDEAGGFPWRGSEVRVPRLVEVLDAFPDVPLLLELKTREAGEAVARLLGRTGAADRVVVAGEDHRGLPPFDGPPFHRGAARRDIAKVFFGLGRPSRHCRCFAVPYRYHGLLIPSRRFVRTASRLESTVHVWTVDDQDSAERVWDSGANGIVTNRPDLVRRWRDARFPVSGAS